MLFSLVCPVLQVTIQSNTDLTEKWYLVECWGGGVEAMGLGKMRTFGLSVSGTRIDTHTLTYTHKHTYTHICIHMQEHTNIHIHTYNHMQVYIYTYAHTQNMHKHRHTQNMPTDRHTEQMHTQCLQI